MSVSPFSTRNEAATKAIYLGLGPDKRLGTLIGGFEVIYDFFCQAVCDFFVRRLKERGVRRRPCKLPRQPCKLPRQSVRRSHWTPKNLLQGMEERHGGLDYATCEASFEAKAPDQSRTGVGGRGVVFIANRGRIFNDRRSGSGYADDSEQRTGS